MSRASLVRLVLLGVIWGASFLLIMYGLEGLSPMQIVLGRLLGATAVLLPVVLLRRLAFPRDPRLWGHLAVMGLVANIVPFWLFGFAEQRVSSGLAGVLNGTTPLFTLVFSLLAVGGSGRRIASERLGPARVAGLLVGFLGTLVVIAPWRPGALSGSLVGQFACLAAAACYATGFVYTRRFVLPSGHPPLVLATCQLGSAALLVAVASPIVAAGPINLSFRVFASVALLGVLMTGVAYLLYYRLIADAGPTSASMVTYLNPIVALVLGIVFLGEPVRWSLFVGATVVIAGVALAEGRIGPRTAAAPPAAAPPREPELPMRRR